MPVDASHMPGRSAHGDGPGHAHVTEKVGPALKLKAAWVLALALTLSACWPLHASKPLSENRSDTQLDPGAASLPKDAEASTGASADVGAAANRRVTAEGSEVVGVVPVEASAGEFRIVRGACRAETCTGCLERNCPARVQWVRAERVVAEAPLAWGMGPGEVTHAPVELVSGVGSSLAFLPGMKPPVVVGWASGYEESMVSLFVRPVRATRDLVCLLVTAAGGFDHLSRRSDVFLPKGETLASAISIEEREGPHFVSIDVLSDSGDADTLVVVSSYAPDIDQWSNTLEANLYRFDAASQEFRQLPPTPAATSPLFGLLVGRFGTLEAATGALTVHVDCAGPFTVLSVEAAGLPGESGFVLAAVTAHRAEAEAAKNAMARCWRNVPLSVVSWPTTTLPEE